MVKNTWRKTDIMKKVLSNCKFYPPSQRHEITNQYTLHDPSSYNVVNIDLIKRDRHQFPSLLITDFGEIFGDMLRN